MMRSISWKLLLAFVVVSLGGTALFFVVARQYSNQEIRDYLLVQDQSRVVDWLVGQYEATGSWDTVDKNWPQTQFIPQDDTPDKPPTPFILVDAEMIVIKGSFGDDRFQVGSIVSEEDLDSAEAIVSNGEIIGWLLIPEPGKPRSLWAHPVLDRMDDLLLISAGGAMLLALVLGLVLSRSLSRPLRKLSQAAQVAATGDLSQKVEVKSKDEIGALAESFNQMMDDLEILISSRRQMTADIAHELRTPISVILGYTEGVHEGVLDPNLETFEIVHDEALRLERLVKDLRLISKADVGELPLDLQEISVESILEEVERTAIGLMLDKQISLEVHQSPSLPHIKADLNRIIQVIRNIIENAVRYTPEKGKITLSVDAVDEKWVRFGIQDQGPGVSEEDLSNIFNRFYRVDPSRTRDHEGSGLGLAIARSIIEQHGGRIWAESRLGEGLSILFDLPVTE